MTTNNVSDLIYEVKDGQEWCSFQVTAGDTFNHVIRRGIKFENKTQLTIQIFYVYSKDNKNSSAVSVIPQLDSKYNFVMEVKCGTKCDYLSRTKTASKLFDGHINLKFEFKIRIYLKPIIATSTLLQDLVASTSPEVFLMAEDGHVPIKKHILVARSIVFEELAHATDEGDDKVLDTIKFKKSELQEFVDFLVTGTLNVTTTNEIALLTLGHNYSVPLLKMKAQQLAIHRLTDKNAGECHRLFLVTCPELLKKHFETTFKQLQNSVAATKLDLSCFKKRAELAHSLLTDVMKFMMTDVTFEAEDGIVVTKRELLMARSSVFKKMLEQEPKEQKTFKIEMKDQKKEVLDEFVHFLMADEIDNDSKNALELLVLADKYDVPLLKNITSQIVIENKQGRDVLELYDALVATCPEILEKHFMETYKSFKSNSGLLEVDGRLFDTFTSKFF